MADGLSAVMAALVSAVMAVVLWSSYLYSPQVDEHQPRCWCKMHGACPCEKEDDGE